MFLQVRFSCHDRPLIKAINKIQLQCVPQSFIVSSRLILIHECLLGPLLPCGLRAAPSELAVITGCTRVVLILHKFPWTPSAVWGLQLALEQETFYLPQAQLLRKYLNEASGVLVCLISDLVRPWITHGGDEAVHVHSCTITIGFIKLLAVCLAPLSYRAAILLGVGSSESCWGCVKQ